MDKIEMLSRMWIECDPNRQPSRPDEMIGMSGPHGIGIVQLPRWHWFKARAEESLRFFEKHGYELREKGGNAVTVLQDGLNNVLRRRAEAERELGGTVTDLQRIARLKEWIAFTAHAAECLRFLLGDKDDNGRAMLDSTGDAECDRTTMRGAVGGAQIGGEAAKERAREAKRQRDLQVLAEAHQVANERGHPGLASSIAHLFGELHLDTAA